MVSAVGVGGGGGVDNAVVYMSSSFILHRHLLSIGASEQHILLNEANEQTGYTLDALSKALLETKLRFETNEHDM